ncbi:restriction of telomere capping protein 5, partial [Patellaria atrata CBS 101060]
RPPIEQLSRHLSEAFATKCYTPLELYCFKEVFRSLCDTESGLRYWSESTLCKFLELPDAIAVGPVIFQMAGYLGAFPFPSQAPAILTNDALIKVVTILTERWGKVVSKRNKRAWHREIYRSLAVYDKNVDDKADETQDRTSAGTERIDGRNDSKLRFEVDAAAGEEGAEDDEDDLILANLNMMDIDEVFKLGEKTNVHHSIVPTDNLLRLIEFILLIAPLEPVEDIATYTSQLSPRRIEELRETAQHVLSSFEVENVPGTTFKVFDAVVSAAMPRLFDALRPLFEHFLFAKDLDLSRRKNSRSSTPPRGENDLERFERSSPDNPMPLGPVLPNPGEILNLSTISQLSFILPNHSLFRRLHPLYAGSTHGFSMGSFEKHVFNWREPTFLLITGTTLPPHPTTPSTRPFTSSLPPSRLPHSSTATVTYGAYIPGPWKTTPKHPFSDASTLLFQLAPTHDLFPAIPHHPTPAYAYFAKHPSPHPGLGFGSPVPGHTAHVSPFVPLGPVSLHIDSALEFAVFTHRAEGGGSFSPSKLPRRKNSGKGDWQDRFEVQELEVWGLGGEEAAELQRRVWDWEEREAERRRRVNLGTGDRETDRELLRLAGLIGERSGGSMG